MIFISRGKRFEWKARALPVLLDELEVCKSCKGNCYKDIYGNDPEPCWECNGHGKELWLEPYDLELERFLQSKIEEYYRTKDYLEKVKHLGENI